MRVIPILTPLWVLKHSFLQQLQYRLSFIEPDSMLLISLTIVLTAATAIYVPNYFKLVLPPSENKALVDSDGRVQPQPVYHPYELQFVPTPRSAAAETASSAETAPTGSGSTSSNSTSSSISPTSSTSTHHGGAPTIGMLAAPFAAGLLLL